MKQYHQHYIDGEWLQPFADQLCEVINPATGLAAGTIVLANPQDVDRAVASAKKAFVSYSQSSIAERIELFESIIAAYSKRIDDVASAITEEMGAPYAFLSQPMQAQAGLGHLTNMLEVIQSFPFEQQKPASNGQVNCIVREAVGVCALITPWNWPMNQITCKVAPALAAGCTMVLKPSEVAPFSAHVFAEIMAEAGVPNGVFNLIDGNGEIAGTALTSHPDIDMISFTGSTRAGKAIAHVAAESVKGIALELGGKSANIILDDCDMAEAVTAGVLQMMHNSGQTCTAPSRMLVPADRLAEVEAIATAACQQIVAGDPWLESTTLGPLASPLQYERVNGLIQQGIDEGAKLVAGGTGRPAGLEQGCFVRPTVFSAVTNDMKIAREEIFGPVLTILPYQNEEDAIAIANDSDYGLAAYVSSSDPDRARRVARRLQAGQVKINGASGDYSLPFGGYKQSGTGREWGVWGLEEYLETKALIG